MLVVVTFVLPFQSVREVCAFRCYTTLVTLPSAVAQMHYDTFVIIMKGSSFLCWSTMVVPASVSSLYLLPTKA